MDQLQINFENTTRPNAIEEVLAVLDRGLKGLRAEMHFGRQVDAEFVNDLEARAKRLRETTVRDPTSVSYEFLRKMTRY